MKRAVLRQQGVLTIADVQEDLTPQAGEVPAGVKIVIVCGSNLSYFQAETLPHDLQHPPVLGYEMAGVIKEAGTAAGSVQKGDRVAVEPQSYCRHCEVYQGGDCDFRESLWFITSKGISGTLKQYMKWPQNSVYKLEDSMSFEEGALLESLSVAYNVVEKLDFHEESGLVVLRTRSVGLLMGVLIQKLYPEASVHLVDVYENKRDMGERLHMKKNQFLVGTVYELGSMRPFTHIIDTIRSSEVVKQFPQHSIPQVVLLELGVSDRPLEISFKGTIYQGLRIIGSYHYTNTYPRLLKLFREQHL